MKRAAKDILAGKSSYDVSILDDVNADRNFDGKFTAEDATLILKEAAENMLK